MSKSVWTIFIMGFLAVVIIVMAMLMSLTLYQASPASLRTRLAQEVQTQFGFNAVAADVREQIGRPTLLIAYETSTDSKFDPAVQKAEMEAVAKFAEARYDGRDRVDILQLRVRRVEIRARGCWTKKIEGEHVVQSPRFTPLKGLDGKPLDREGRMRLR